MSNERPTRTTVDAKKRLWHDRAMPRARSTTRVDKDLLDSARRPRATANDAELIDEVCLENEQFVELMGLGPEASE